VNRFNAIYQQFIAMYDSGCQIYCNWSRLIPGIMPQINMIPHSVTLNWHWDNHPCPMP